MCLSTYAIFSQNLRDGEQNLLSVLNLIYVAHNGRGVGLPDCLPFLSKFHYIEFSMTCSTRCVCQLTQFILKTSAMESKTFCGFLFSFMWAHNGKGVGLSDYLPFLEKFHYVEFSAASYTGVGCPLKECFLKTSAMESKTFCGFLISYLVPTKVGMWVYRIVYFFVQNSITSNFK